MRNASCEGRWDAAEDDLAAALPPRRGDDGDDARDGQEGRDGDGGGGGGGDKAWLSQLAAAAGPAPDARPRSARPRDGGAAPDQEGEGSGHEETVQRDAEPLVGGAEQGREAEGREGGHELLRQFTQKVKEDGQ